MENDAQREDVAGGVELLSFFAGDDFRSHIPWSATSVEDVVFGIDVCSQSEVDNDWI